MKKLILTIMIVLCGLVLSAQNKFTYPLYMGKTGTATAKIYFYGLTSGIVELRVADAAGTNVVFQLPNSNGTSNYFLKTNGSGVTSWSTIPQTSVEALSDSLIDKFTRAQSAARYVPLSRTVNSKPLTGNISIGASDVSLGNVTNESKATMFTNPEFTGSVITPIPTLAGQAANKGYVDGAITMGVIWVAPVEDIVSTLPNGIPISQRYIYSTDGHIYTSDGDNTWTDLGATATGTACYVKTEVGAPVNYIGQYNYSGSAWNYIGASANHNDLLNIQGGQAAQYYHLSNIEYVRQGQAATSVVSGYLSSTDWSAFNGKLSPTGSAANLTSFPTFNQNTTGNAATATKLAATKTINTVAWDGSTNITVPSDIAPSTQGKAMLSNGTTWESIMFGDDLLDYSSTTYKYMPYASKSAGTLYTGTGKPTNTNRLNFDGAFYATRIGTDTIKASNSSSAAGTDLYLKGGDAAPGFAGGAVNIQPGRNYIGYDIINFGRTSYSSSPWIVMQLLNSGTNAGFWFVNKGTANFMFEPANNIRHTWGATSLEMNPISDFTINVGTETESAGNALKVFAGNAQTAGASNFNGGDLILGAGRKSNSGLHGNLYLKTSNNEPYIKDKTTETEILYYNSTSGLVSKGVAGSPGGVTEVTGGGTGRATGTTAYSLIATGTTPTGAQQTVATGSAGDVFMSNGAAALPSPVTPTPFDDIATDIDDIDVDIADAGVVMKLITDTLRVTDATYTLVLTDAGKTIRAYRTTWQRITVPLNSSVAFPIGTVITVKQDGAGIVKFLPASGVVFKAPLDSLTMNTRYSWVQLIKQATNKWEFVGRLED